KTQADAGIGSMEEGSLALDQIPVLRLVGGREPFDRARDEVGDNRIDGDAIAGYEDARLARRTEISPDAEPLHFPLDRQRRIHLADRTVRADGEQAFSRTPEAIADLELARRMANVEQLPAQFHVRHPTRKFEVGNG